MMIEERLGRILGRSEFGLSLEVFFVWLVFFFFFFFFFFFVVVCVFWWFSGWCSIVVGVHGVVSLFFFFFFFCFLGLPLQHMEVPRLGVQLELQPPAYAIATAMPDLSRICDLYHSSRQHQILKPLREARVGTRILMDTCQIRNLLSRHRNSWIES